MKHLSVVVTVLVAFALSGTCSSSTTSCRPPNARFISDQRGCNPVGDEKRFISSTDSEQTAIQAHILACAQAADYSGAVRESDTVPQAHLTVVSTMLAAAAAALSGHSLLAIRRIREAQAAAANSGVGASEADWKRAETLLERRNRSAFVALRNAYFGVHSSTKEIDPNYVQDRGLTVLYAFDGASRDQFCSGLSALAKQLGIDPDNDGNWWAAGTIAAYQTHWSDAKTLFAKALIATEPTLPGNTDVVTPLRFSEMRLLAWSIHQDDSDVKR